MSCTNAAPEPTFTGERVVPGKTPPFLVLEHLLRYRFAAPFSDGLRVLDVGCGTGYGTAILAETASLTIGVDSDPEAVHYAHHAYRRTHLSYTLADCRDLPFRDRSFELAVFFEVMEHIREQDRCLGELRRVLSPDGILILSTPNALRSTKVIEEENPFHHKELNEDELRELLRRHFNQVQLLYQSELCASSIQSPTLETTGPVEVVEDFSAAPAPKYFIAVCGARPATVSRHRSLGVGGIEHQIAIIKDLRQAQKEIIALLHQREENEREYGRNLATHRKEIDALLHQREENEGEYGRNLATHRKEIEALLRQREGNEREYARNLAAHAEVIRQLEERTTRLEGQCAVQRTELEWLYRWIPVNKLARKFLYGRNLRRRLMSIFRPP
jgi:2-polyprenyl-3-methyl-5-hydroxy-6-metoxy-1,4-benzoquinol methylase